jgi:hypothetical protein
MNMEDLTMTDNVNKPNHYTQGSIEVIDYIMDQKFDYLEGNIIKYISRYKFKNGLEDLKKARVYLDKLILRNSITCKEDYREMYVGHSYTWEDLE